MKRNTHIDEQLKCFIDVETTGCNRDHHEVHQVAAIITNADGTEVLDNFKMDMAPMDPFQAFEDGALEKCKVTKEQLLDRPTTSKEAFLNFIDFLDTWVDRYDKHDKFQFIAYNSNFDEDFIRRWFEMNEDNYYGSWFWHPTICLMKAMAWIARDCRGNFQNFRLETMCNQAGVEFNEDEAHDAMYDIEKTRQLFVWMNEKL